MLGERAGCALGVFRESRAVRAIVMDVIVLVGDV